MRKIPQLIQPLIKSKLTLNDIGNLYFGDEANTFAEGNDNRLSDSRSPNGIARGDLTGTYPNPTLTLTGVVASTYGDSTHVPQITVDAKGRLTSVSSIAISYPVDYITSISDTNSIDLNVTTGTLTANILKQNSTSINLSIDSSGLKAIRNALTGDVTSPSDSNITTLATVASAATKGSASKSITQTINAKGLTTSLADQDIQITESQVTNLTADLASKQSTALTNTHILLGNASNIATDVAISGDATIANTGILILGTVNSNVGVFGNATQVPVITVNGKGLITAVSNTTITPAASSITGGQTLSKADDTNVTLTLGGSPTTSLLSATSLTLGWTGTLSDSRLSTTAVTAASYGSASQIPTYTVSATGRLTAAANVAIQIAESQVTNLVSDLASLVVSPGTIQMWGAPSSPIGWLLCDGSSVSRATYSSLFAIIGITFGSVDGTHFTLPDFRGYFPFGKSTSGTGSTLGGTFGTIDHLHTVDPPSTSTSSNGSHNHGGGTGTPSATQNNTALLNLTPVPNVTHTHTISSDGTHTHTLDISSFDTGLNNPPGLAINFIIKI